MCVSAATRVSAKTREQRFVHTLTTDFEFAPRVAEEVLATAREILIAGDPAAQPLRPGQIRQLLAAEAAPYGRDLRDTDMVEVTWSIDDGPEDAELLLTGGPVALRQARILRLAEEAVDQGGLATEEDLARALHVNTRTIRRDIAALQAKGLLIPTRGKVKGAGRGQSHKAVIVDLFLQGYTYTQIQRRTQHSLAAIHRYISWFGRVAFLHQRGLPAPSIAPMLGLSQHLVGQYLQLLQSCQDPARQATLCDLTTRLGGQLATRNGEGGALLQ